VNSRNVAAGCPPKGSNLVFSCRGTSERRKEVSMAGRLWRGVLCWAWGAVLPAAYANTYEVVDLGNTYYALGLNDKGEVAGFTQQEPYRGAIYRDGHWRAFKRHSIAWNINDHGDEVGKKYGSQVLKLWPNKGSPMPIEVPGDGYPANALLVNRARLVAGVYDVNGQTACYTWTPDGGPVSMGLHGGACDTLGMSESGYVTGSSGADAFLYKNGSFADLGGLPGASESAGAAVNNKGQVAGYSAFQNDFGHAFLWNGSEFVDLSPEGYRPAQALGINDDGVIVGFAELPAAGRAVAARFEVGKITSLEDEVPHLGAWKLYIALAVNRSGMILGEGQVHGQSHYFLLMPIGHADVGQARR
jgi:probable HAF family extracellular repeat protein